MSQRETPRRSSRVPVRRLERLARIGVMSAEFALGSMAGGVKRLLGGDSADSGLLNVRNAERLARRLASMRGAAMKVGQMISLVDDSMVPAEFSEALAVLRASADTMPESQVRRSLLRAYGRSWRERFRLFDFEPIAAASIGQVHTAVASDARELALKIQYPGVAESIESDIDNLATAFKAARILPFELQLEGLIEEAKSQLRQEADYLREAQHLRDYRGRLGDDPGFVVPDVYADLTTSRILAMQRLYGLPLEDLKGPEHTDERRDEVCSAMVRLLYRELFDFRLMQTDPNFSNYLMLGDNRIGLLDFGSTLAIDPALSRRYLSLFAAIRSNDVARIREASLEIGYLMPGDSDAQAEAFVALLRSFLEPLGFDRPYDFSSSGFLLRIQEAKLDLVMRKRFVRMPPPATIFVQRKLGGMLMLCSRLRARVDFAALLEPFLG